MGVGGGGPAEGSRGSAQILDAPAKMLNTHHNTTRHTTQHNGGSLAGRSMVQKTRHEQQIVLKSGQGFLGSRMVRKGLGTERFVKKRAKRRSGPKVVRA